MVPAPNILESIPTLEADIPAESLAGLPMLPYMLGASAVLIAVISVVALLWWNARRRRPPVPTLTPLQEALGDLAKLEAELPPLRPFALRLSLIIRTYLAGCAQDPALYETQEEFSQRMDSLATLPAACRETTRALLDELAAYKYAAESEDGSLLAAPLLERSRDLLQRLEIAREEAEQEKGGEEA